MKPSAPVRSCETFPRPMCRVWLWLGVSLFTSVLVIVGIAFVAFPVRRFESLKIMGGAVLLAVLMLRQSRSDSGPLWRILPALDSRQFQHLLLPHLFACSGGILAACCLILHGVSERSGRKGWMETPNGTALFITLVLGGDVISLGGLLWGIRRRRSLGLP